MKRILVDCDGVILNWEYAFHVWLEQHGHEPAVLDQGLFYRISEQYGLSEDNVVRLVHTFNESAAIGFLPPLRDAVQYVKMLHNDGYVFHAITSVSDNPNVEKLRIMNLNKLFGEEVFEHVKCLPIGSSKKEYLSQFKDSGYYWIEDNEQNALDGHELGLQSILMEHGYTMHYQGPMLKFKNWEEIYNHIVKDNHE